MRKAEVSANFVRWLERYSPPRNISENTTAQQDEVQSLLGVILKFAPQSGYVEFTETALDRMDYQMKTRAWPTKGELGLVCSNLRKETAVHRTDMTGDGPDTGTIAINARRMNRGEPVGEGWLYGISACEIIAAGNISEATMKAYRSGAYFARRSMYGEAPARAWQADREAAHEAAKAVWRARGSDPTPRNAHIPTKPMRSEAVA